MKALILTGSLLLILCSNSCKNSKSPWYYSLMISIQDASGNDLIKGIAYYPNPENILVGIVKPDVYTLNVSEPCCIKVKSLPLRIYENNYFIGYYDGFSDPTEVITFSMICSYIFKNDEEYEIITYWSPVSKKRQRMKCYRIDFDGKEYIPTLSNDYDSFSVATIILNLTI